jgi:hypothetical protein
MVPGEGKAANPFHSLAALQKLAHHASFRTAPAVAFPLDHDRHLTVKGRQPSSDRISCTLFKSHPWKQAETAERARELSSSWNTSGGMAVTLWERLDGVSPHRITLFETGATR